VRFLRRRTLQRYSARAATLVSRSPRLIFAVFLPWYLAALTFYPLPWLWWIATGVALALLAVTLRWPRSMLIWLPPAVMLFNNIQQWLPWPYVKLCLIGPAVVCFSSVFPGAWPGRRRYGVSVVCMILFACLCAAALLGVASQVAWYETAAWDELGMQLRQVPLLDEQKQYVPLRYMWVWALALCTFSVVSARVRNERDILTMLWSMQGAAMATVAFGIYSFQTQRFMVSHYVFERRINATFSSPAVLADMLTALFILGLYMLRRSRTWFARGLLLVMLVAEFTAIMLSGCRANLLILLLFGMVWGGVLLLRTLTARRRRAALRTLIIGTAVVAAVVGATLAMPRALEVRLSRVPVLQRFVEWRQSLRQGRALETTLLSGRREHWACARNMLRDSPLWGIGAGLFEQRYVDYRLPTDLFQFARAHNVFLRVAAEGGVVTLAALLVFVGVSAWRLRHAFAGYIVAARPRWARWLQVFAFMWLGLLLGACVSDITIENMETQMMLALFAACTACAYRRVAPLFRWELHGARRAWRMLERRLQALMGAFGWDYLGDVSLRTMLTVIAVAVLALLLQIGLGRAQFQCRQKLRNGRLSYGFQANTTGTGGRPDWFSMARSAMTGQMVTRPVFTVQYRALNDRMVSAQQTLNVYVNGRMTEKLRLLSKEPSTFYCDVTSLKGKWVSIEFETPRTFIPWQERWFADPHPYGALLTKPVWLGEQPSNLIGRTEAAWSILWTAYPEFYLEQGYSNLAAKTFGKELFEH
jgi:O-antigen ligase